MAKLSYTYDEDSSFLDGNLFQLADNKVAFLFTRQGTFYDKEMPAGKYYYETKALLLEKDSIGQDWSIKNSFTVDKSLESPDNFIFTSSLDDKGYIYSVVRGYSEHEVSVLSQGGSTERSNSILEIYNYSVDTTLDSRMRIPLGLSDENIVSKSQIVTGENLITFWISESDSTQSIEMMAVDIKTGESIHSANLTNYLLSDGNSVNVTEISATLLPDSQVVFSWQQAPRLINGKVVIPNVSSAIIDLGEFGSSGSFDFKKIDGGADLPSKDTSFSSLPSSISVPTSNGKRYLRAVTLNNIDQKGSDIVLLLFNDSGKLLDRINLHSPQHQKSSLLSFDDLSFIVDEKNKITLEATAALPSLALQPFQFFADIRIVADRIKLGDTSIQQGSQQLIESMELLNGLNFTVTNKPGTGLTGGELIFNFDKRSSKTFSDGKSVDLSRLNAKINKFAIKFDNKSQDFSHLPSLPLPIQRSLSTSSALNGLNSSLEWLPKTSFAVIGDYGNVFYNDLRTEASPAVYVANAISQLNPDFILSLGDDNYVEGKINWKDFNTGKLFAPYIEPYTVISDSRSGRANASTFAVDGYLGIPRKNYNRFFPLPGNHDLGLLQYLGNDIYLKGAAGLTRSYSFDPYYQSAITKGSSNIRPLSYAYGGTSLNYGFNMSMPTEYMDYVVNPIDKNGIILESLANLYMVDRNKYFYQGGGLDYDMQSDVILADAKQSSKPWNIYLSHYPTFSSETLYNDKNSEGITKSMDKDFASNNIDLVIGAHVHNYERFDIPGKGHYIVNGNGGYNTFYTSRGEVWADYVSLGGAVWDGLKWDLSKKPNMSGLVHADDALFGFGWIDMDETRLVYTQYALDLPLVKTGDLVGDALKVNGDIRNSYARISDQLILNKFSAETTLNKNLSAGINKPNLREVFSVAPEVNVLSQYRLNPTNGYGDIFVDNFNSAKLSADPVNLLIKGSFSNDTGEVTRLITGQQSSQILIESQSGIFIDDIQDHLAVSTDSNLEGRHYIHFDLSKSNTSPKQSLPSNLEVLFRNSKQTLTNLAGSALIGVLNNYISSGPSDDIIVGSRLNDFIRVGEGDDDVILNGGRDLVELGSGHDSLRLNASKASLIMRNDLNEDSNYAIYDWGRNDSLFIEDGLKVSSDFGSSQLILQNANGFSLTLVSIDGKPFVASQLNHLT